MTDSTTEGWQHRAWVLATTPPLVASGGICAPTAPLYDVFRFLREPWEYPDRPCWLGMDADGRRTRAWLFPRWTRTRWLIDEARGRIDAAWTVLRHGVPEPEGDDW